MTELNTMSVHALSERVENLEQQLAAAEAIIEGERDRAKEREIEYHEQRRMREDAEAELERVQNRVVEIGIAAEALADAETDYRHAHDFKGDGSIEAGRAWDNMRRKSKALRDTLASPAAEPVCQSCGGNGPVWCHNHSEAQPAPVAEKCECSLFERASGHTYRCQSGVQDSDQTWEVWAVVNQHGELWSVGQHEDIERDCAADLTGDELQYHVRRVRVTTIDKQPAPATEPDKILMPKECTSAIHHAIMRHLYKGVSRCGGPEAMYADIVAAVQPAPVAQSQEGEQ